MALCNITGLLRDSGDNLLSGELWVQLDQAVVDIDTTPDSTILPRLFKFAIASGSVNISLRESETHRVTYRFRFFASSGSPAVLDSDPSIDFHAFVPALASCEFADLLPTSITADLRDTAIARLARLLTTNQQFAAALRGGPRYLGVYSASTYYQLDDCVSYGGSSWIWISATPAAGSTPSTLNSNWMQSGAKGEPGAGVTGQDTAFNSAGWDGATWVPTANAIRDYLVLLATLTSPAFAGAPTCPTPSNASNDTTIINSAWAKILLAASLTDTVLAGSPTIPTTAPATQADTRAISAAWVKSAYHRYSRVVDRKASGTGGGASAAGFNTRVLQTIDVNAGDILSVTSNVVTLRPGTYRFAAQAPCSNGLQHRLDLFNNTAGTVVAVQVNVVAYAGTAAITTATTTGIFTIAANTAFVLRHNIATVLAATGLGLPMSDGNPEVYAVIEFWRID
jgi:hypothetical protein